MSKPSEHVRTIHGPDGDVEIWDLNEYGFAAYKDDEKVGLASHDYDYVVEEADKAAGRDPDTRKPGD